jgi:hypothetical protein
MGQFYKALLAGQSPAAAIQVAQNVVRKYTENDVEQRLRVVFNVVLQSAAKGETPLAQTGAARSGRRSSSLGVEDGRNVKFVLLQVFLA